MLELDLILNQFVSKQLDSLDSSQLTLFEKLLNYPDPVLYVWLTGQEPAEKEMTPIVATIRANSST